MKSNLPPSVRMAWEYLGRGSFKDFGWIVCFAIFPPPKVQKLEHWSDGVIGIRKIQGSNTRLFARISFHHLVKKALFLKFLEKTQVNELLRLGVFRLGHLFCQHVEHELNPFEGWVGLFRNHLDVALIGLFMNGGVVGAPLFDEEPLRLLLIGVDEINDLQEFFNS